MYTKKKLDEKVHLLRNLEREAEDINTRIENLKTEIKQEMTERGVTELVGDDWRVTWTPYSTSRFDQSAFKESYPDLYESFKMTTESRRFNLK